MDPSALVPTPDPIPAPPLILLVLEMLTFMLHILLINVVLGGSLIILFYRLGNKNDALENSLPGSAAGKIPTAIALGINLGVAPLLFVQVIYGHLFYSSSVLMAVFWILIIPLLILAYYGAYIHIRKYDVSRTFSKIALILSVLFVLYIGLMFVNNLTLGVQPEKWSGYFANPGGTLLNMSDPTIFPRYLHFVTASVAVGGLFIALIWYLRKRRGTPDSDQKIRTGLMIFGGATAVQIVVGIWFLMALPRDIMLSFMGQDMFATIILMLGILSAIGALIFAFTGKLIPALVHLILTVVFMVITRQNLRSFYLEDVMRLDQLPLSPQYGMLILFLIVFVIGLGVVAWLVRTATRIELKGGQS